MICDQKIENLQWQAQGNTFTSSIGILPLKCFDMVLGQDWLESCSPMWVHWSKKLMKFTYKGQRVSLHGITADMTQCPAVNHRKFQGFLNRQAVAHMIQLQFQQLDSQLFAVNEITAVHEEIIPDGIQKLLEVYHDVFQTSTELPPPRPFDHRI